MTSASIDILRNLEPIVPEWWELFSRCDDATPFQSPAWLVPWWNCFGRGQPIVITERRHHQLCGLAVLYLYQPAELGGQQLVLVGRAVSDYLDILVAPGQQRVEVARELINSALDFVEPRCQCLHLERVPPTSPILQMEPAFTAEVEADGICPQLALTGRTVQDFVPRKRTSDNLRNRLCRVQAAGRVQFITASHRTCASLMHELLRLHSKRWNSLGVPGIFSDRNMVRFLCQAGPQLLSAGMLRLHAMLLNDLPIAITLGMLHRQRAYLYNFGFDPAYSVFSPASQVIAFAMEQAAQQGARVFDFLQGDEPYKFHTWGATPRYTYRLTCRRASRQHPHVCTAA
jgi:CelD/BcsL family acetyltransferase involved in cellulose biosynthesis